MMWSVTSVKTRLLLLIAAGLLAGAARPSGGKGKSERAKAGDKTKQTSGDKTPAATLPGSPPADGKAIRVAVLELGTLGMSNDERRSLEMLLRNSIATIEGYAVVPLADIQMALSDPKNLAVAQCGGGPDCAVQIGRVVGADRVVFGTLSTIGDAFSLNLRVMDVKLGKELAREQSRTSGNRNVLIPEVRLSAYRLVAPDKIRGYLEIVSSVDGVDIEINGQKVGTTPLAAPVPVIPGDQVVVARRAGFTEFQKEFHLVAFERVKLRLDLGKAPDGAPAASP
ncbi:MAG: DUF2380 domain-containing protein [Deltaproteobacteria bacterium]|nr:DUF2380 domain-containing protein [Deltaproteobacteria bacterium]